MTNSEVLERVTGYLSGDLHTIVIGVVDPDGKPYTKCMDILSAQPYGGVYIYGQNTEKLDRCLAACPYVSMSGITGCAFSRIKEIDFEGKLEKVDRSFTKELIEEDPHVSELLAVSESAKDRIGIYHVTSGTGTFDDIYAGRGTFTL